MNSQDNNINSLDNKLFLYRYAVQHPEAEVNFLERAYMHYFDDTRPTLLREDFAGTCAISGAWVELDEDNRALAVEIDEDTAIWADHTLFDTINTRAEDVIILVDDVMNVIEPNVDIVASMNFSTLIYHNHHDLLSYLQHVRKCLEDNGIFVMDVFGGQDATTIGKQERDLSLPHGINLANNGDSKESKLKYIWEQRAYDQYSHKIDCRIHFKLSNGTCIKNAFVYDWKLWSLKEIQATMIEAGFELAEVWLDDFDEETGLSNGFYSPAKEYPTRKDWVAYIVAVKRSAK